jgi:MFS family permease
MDEALSRAIAPLRNPLYRSLWFAALASNIGTWMHSVAAAWLMTTLAATPLMIALVQTAALLPTFLFGLLGGVLADTKDRRSVLLFTQSWMLGAACLIGFVTLAGWITPMWLLILTFALGFGQALNGPAWQTATPQIASNEEMPAVIALNGVQFNIARAIGPAIGGLLMAATSAGVVFLINAMSFLGVILVFWQWKPDTSRHPRIDAHPLDALRDGLRYVRRSRAHHALLARCALFSGSFSAMWALLPVVALTLNASALEYGLLLGCAGLGAVTGAGIHAILRAQFDIDGQAACGIVVGACSLAGLALSSSFVTAAMASLGCGISWMITVSVFNVRGQTAAPAPLRARSLSVYMLVFQGSTAAGAGLWGAVAERWGVHAALFTAAACVAVGLGLGYPFPLEDREEAPAAA